jgi:GNAT superfamily N-acetyltransferase
MSVRIITWQEADINKLRELYIRFPYPPYFGSSIVDEQMQAYRFRCVQKEAETSPATFLAAVDGRRFLCTAQLHRTNHLSDHFGIEVASITNEAFVCDNAAENVPAFLSLIEALKDYAKKVGVAFITTTAASQAFQWIRALEDSGFRYADGFRHVTASIEEDYGAFLRDDLLMRDPVDADFEEIAYSYDHMPFPNHLLYEPEFDKGKVTSLYVKRYREVHAELGRVFVAEWKGKFAGALNGVIDQNIKCSLGIAVNHLSQGLIVHPRAKGKGVGLALIAHRNSWYREQGVKLGYFGSNINNLPMIRGLEKMRTKHAGIEISMILRLKDRPS